MSVRAFANYVHDWETPELAAEVQNILDAIDAPPIDDHGLFTFQKILYRTKYFDYDARGQIILTCRCIFESEGNEGAFAEPFISAVHDVCSKKEFADRGLDLIQAFDQIPLRQIVETMRGLDLFKEPSIRRYLSMIVENKVRRILFPPQPEPVSKKERIEAASQGDVLFNDPSLRRGGGTPCRATGNSARPSASSVATIHCRSPRGHARGPGSMAPGPRSSAMSAGAPWWSWRRRQRQRQSARNLRPSSWLANASPVSKSSAPAMHRARSQRPHRGRGQHC
jgi:hypothetical protein